MNFISTAITRIFVFNTVKNLHNKVFRIVFTCCLLLSTVWSSSGQSTVNYEVIPSATNSLTSDINGNVINMTLGTTTLLAAGTDDTPSALTNLNLGSGNIFDFYLMGNRYTQFGISDNGILTLGVTPGSGVYALANGTIPTISAFANDMRVGSDGKVEAKVVGNYPNRTLVVQWTNNMIRYAAAAPGTGTWQVRVYERTGIIEYVYGTMTTNTASPANYFVGFSIANSLNNVLTLNTTANTINRNTPTTANSYTASSIITALSSTADGARKSYQFLSPGNTAHTVTPTLAAPTGLSFSAIGLTTTTVNWAPSSPTTGILKYAVYNSTDGVNYNFAGLVNLGTNTLAVTGLLASTTYYWKVFAVSEGALSANSLDGTQATAACSISGLKTVGATGDYTSITSAIAALTTNGVSGPVILELQTNYTPEGAINLTSIQCASATNTITIRPAAAVSAPIVLTAATGTTVNINGGKYYIIDGRNGGTGTNKYITLQNSGTAGIAVQLINDATNNIIQYCTVRSVNTSTTAGSVVFGTSATGVTGNDNNTIDRCDILDGTTLPTNAIYSAGTSTAIDNSGNTISNNNIANYFAAATNNANGIFLASNSSAWTITGNRFYQSATRTQTSGTVIRAIQIVTASGGGYTIANNIIGFANNAGTGVTTYTGSTVRVIGIDITSSAALPSTVNGNQITGLSVTSTSGGSATIPVFAGIMVQSGAVNMGSTEGNIIGGATGTGSISVIGGTANYITYGIYVSSTATSTVENNVVGSINLTGSAANIFSNFTGIYTLGTAGNFTINNNLIGSKTTSGSLVAGVNATTTGNQVFYGIRNEATGNIVMGASGVGNTVQNVSVRTSGAGSFYPVYNSGAATSLSMQYNLVTGVEVGHVSASASTTFGAIYNGGVIGTVLSISNNTVENNSLNTTGTITLINNASNTASTNIQNNILNNVSRGPNAASGSFVGIAAGASPSSTTGIHNTSNNTITNILSSATTGTSTFVGVSILTATGPTWNTFDNTISGITVGSGTSYGIQAAYGNNKVYNNQVFNVQSGGTFHGINSGGSVVTSELYKNKVYDIVGTAAGSIIYGMSVTGGGTISVYNNLIGNLTAQIATQTFPSFSIAGIHLLSGTTVNVYHNTVLLNATSTGANFTTTAINLGAAGTTNTLRNNIFANRSTGTGLGKALAILKSSTSLANYSTASNNNLYYVSDPNGQIFHNSTTGYTTLAAFQGLVTARETLSITENPNFLSTTGSSTDFLHIDPTIGTQIESGGGALIATVPTDFDGEARFGAVGYIGTGTGVDIGADEFEGVLADITPPTISYTALTAACAGARTLVATITDVSSIPTAGAGLPTLYFSINGGAYAAVTATSLGSNQFQFVFAGAALAGDIVRYYVVAQDNAPTPNVGVSPNAGASGFTFNPPAVSVAPTTPNSYTVFAPLNGIYSVGTGNVPGETGHFATLTAAIDAYNTLCIGGAVTYVLTDPTYSTGETFPLTINDNAQSSVTNTLTIKPNTAIDATITGLVNTGALFNIFTKYVTIDGSNNGTNTRNLTLVNTSTLSTSQTLMVGSTGINPITNVTVKNSNIVNGTNTSSAVVISSTAGTNGYFNNISLINNSIQRAYIGIYVLGASDAGNGNGLLIDGNTLNTAGANSIRLVAIYLQGVDGAAVISNNLIGGMVNANAESPRAIWLATGTNNTTINNNTVNGITSSNTGTYGAAGIYVSSATANNILINQNTISNLNNSGSANSFGAIFSFSQNVNITNNTISALRQIGGTSTAAAWGIISAGNTNASISGNKISDISSAGINSATGINIQGASSNLNIFQNEISNIKQTNTTGYGSNGLYLSSTTTAANIRVYNNFISDIASYGYASAVANTRNSNGIVIADAAGYEVDFNTVRMNSNQTLAGITSAINIPSNLATANAIKLRNNILVNTQTVGTTQNYAIYCASPNTLFGTINNNNYYSATTNLGYLGSNRMNLAAIQTGFGQNSNSINVNPVFVSAINLHLNTLGNNALNGAAIPISGIESDIDNDVRDASTPDIGADEFVPTQNDAGITGIVAKFCPGTENVVVALKNYGINPLTEVTINWSVNGVPQTTFNWIGNLASDATTQVTIGTFNFVVATNYNFSISTSLPNGVADEDVSNDGYTNTTVQTGLNGTYTVGATGMFTTITKALEAVNNNGLCGATVLSLIDANYSTNETFPLTVNTGINSSATNTLTIKPGLSVNATITGNHANALIKLQAADYVTIDGSNTENGATRNLSITNNNVGISSVIWIASSIVPAKGATFNTIKNTNIAGVNTVDNIAGITSMGEEYNTIANNPNSNNTILNNAITRAQEGILVIGSNSNSDQNWSIRKNEIGSTTAASKISFDGIYLGNIDNFVIDSNTVIGGTLNTSSTITGITMEGNISNGTVTRNTIKDVRNTSTIGYGSAGLYVASNLTNSNLLIANNFISDVSSYGYATRGSGDNGNGLVIDNGGGYNIYNNTIRLTTNQTLTSGLPAAVLIGSFVTTPGAINLVNNIIVNNQTTGTQRNAIVSMAPNTVFGTMNYNDFYTAGTTLGFIGSVRANLAAVQAGFGQNANSLNINPTFVSLTDLHLDATVNATLNDKGTPIADVTEDIDTDIRNTITPDMGADEFSPCGTTLYTWIGKTNTDWNTTSNWCRNLVPTTLTDVVIPAGVQNYPIIFGGITGQAKTITINAGVPDVAIQVNGTLQVAGNFINNASITNLGTIKLSGTTAQSFPGPGTIANGGNMHNLEIAATTGINVTINKEFGITGKLTPTSGTIVLNQNITLRSSATATANVAPMTTSAAINYGTGRFVVERFINVGPVSSTVHGKSWQFLSTPVQSEALVTTRANWQESGATPIGYGTWLSDPAGTGGGYDVGGVVPSMKFYQSSDDSWKSKSSTSLPITEPKGYMVYVRGDRNVVTSSQTALNPTNMRITGKLYDAQNLPTPVPITAPNTFESVGNPYASTIDFLKFKQLNSGIDEVFYVWDPTIGGSFGSGGYQTLAVATGYVPTGGISVLYNSSMGPITTIQSGQAFFVKSSSAGATTINFAENIKTDGSRLVNRTGTADIMMLSTAIITASGNIADGNRVVFDNIYSNEVDAYDALKMANAAENLSVKRSNKLLAVEARQKLVATDTLYYNIGGLSNQTYKFNFAVQNLAYTGLEAVLIDKFLNTKIPVSLFDSTNVPFTITSDARSKANDRFMMVFRAVAGPLPVNFVSISASRNADRTIAVNWKVDNELNIDKYTVERSANGLQFTGILTTAATNSNSYTKNDLSPLQYDNFYRVKATSTNGSVQYSAVVKVAPAKEPAQISVYPNPVVNKTIQLRFLNEKEGTYNVQIFNAIGQVVYSDKTEINSSSFVKIIQLGKSNAAGNYQLVISSAEGTAKTIQVILD